MENVVGDNCDTEDRYRSEDDLEMDDDDDADSIASDDEDYHDPDSDDDQSCPICLNDFDEQQIGLPNNCRHVFCVDCILEWSKNANSCPVDRKQFQSLRVYHRFAGLYSREVCIQDSINKVEDGAYEIETLCEICNRGDNEETLLLCDGCDAGFHCGCLSPSLDVVPAGEWFCDRCKAQRRGGLSSAQPRLVGRTNLSERVRSRISQTRRRYAENYTTLDEQLDAIVDEILLNASHRFREITPSFPKRQQSTRKASRRRRSRRRTRKRKRGRSGSRKSSSAGGNKSNSFTKQDVRNMHSFSLTGGSNDLNDFNLRNANDSGLPSHVIAQRHRLLSQSALQFNKPLPSLFSLHAEAETSFPPMSPPPPMPDLLSSILSGQELLFTPGDQVTIQRSGSLKLNEKKSPEQNRKQNVSSQLPSRDVHALISGTPLLSKKPQVDVDKRKEDEIIRSKSKEILPVPAPDAASMDLKSEVLSSSSKEVFKSSSTCEPKKISLTRTSVSSNTPKPSIMIKQVFSLPKSKKTGDDETGGWKALNSGKKEEVYDPFRPTESDEEVDDKEEEINGDEKEIDGKPQNKEIDGKPQNKEIDGKPQNIEIDGKPQNIEIDGKPQNKEIDGKPQNIEIDGKPQNKEISGNPLTKEIDGKPQTKEIDGKPLTNEIDRKPQSKGIDGKPRNKEVESKPEEKRFEPTSDDKKSTKLLKQDFTASLSEDREEHVNKSPQTKDKSDLVISEKEEHTKKNDTSITSDDDFEIDLFAEEELEKAQVEAALKVAESVMPDPLKLWRDEVRQVSRNDNNSQVILPALDLKSSSPSSKAPLKFKKLNRKDVEEASSTKIHYRKKKSSLSKDDKKDSKRDKKAKKASSKKAKSPEPEEKTTKRSPKHRSDRTKRRSFSSHYEKNDSAPREDPKQKQRGSVENRRSPVHDHHKSVTSSRKSRKRHWSESNFTSDPPLKLSSYQRNKSPVISTSRELKKKQQKIDEELVIAREKQRKRQDEELVMAREKQRKRQDEELVMAREKQRKRQDEELVIAREKQRKRQDEEKERNRKREFKKEKSSDIHSYSKQKKERSNSFAVDDDLLWTLNSKDDVPSNRSQINIKSPKLKKRMKEEKTSKRDDVVTFGKNKKDKTRSLSENDEETEKRKKKKKKTSVKRSRSRSFERDQKLKKKKHSRTPKKRSEKKESKQDQKKSRKESKSQKKLSFEHIFADFDDLKKNKKAKRRSRKKSRDDQSTEFEEEEISVIYEYESLSEGEIISSEEELERLKVTINSSKSVSEQSYQREVKHNVKSLKPERKRSSLPVKQTEVVSVKLDNNEKPAVDIVALPTACNQSGSPDIDDLLEKSYKVASTVVQPATVSKSENVTKNLPLSPKQPLISSIKESTPNSPEPRRPSVDVDTDHHISLKEPKNEVERLKSPPPVNEELFESTSFEPLFDSLELGNTPLSTSSLVVTEQIPANPSDSFTSGVNDEEELPASPVLSIEAMIVEDETDFLRSPSNSLNQAEVDQGEHEPLHPVANEADILPLIKYLKSLKQSDNGGAGSSLMQSVLPDISSALASDHNRDNETRLEREHSDREMGIILKQVDDSYLPPSGLAPVPSTDLPSLSRDTTPEPQMPTLRAETPKKPPVTSSPIRMSPAPRAVPFPSKAVPLPSKGILPPSRGVPLPSKGVPHPVSMKTSAVSITRKPDVDRITPRKAFPDSEALVYASSSSTSINDVTMSREKMEKSSSTVNSNKSSELYSPSNPISPTSPSMDAPRPVVDSASLSPALSLASKFLQYVGGLGMQRANKDEASLKSSTKTNSHDAKNPIGSTHVDAKDSKLYSSTKRKNVENLKASTSTHQSKSSNRHKTKDLSSSVIRDSQEKQTHADFQRQVVNTAKAAIMPYFKRRDVSKEQYKGIMKKAVNKICKDFKGKTIEREKIKKLIDKYVKNCLEVNNINQEKMRLLLNRKANKRHKRKKEYELDFSCSPPSPEESSPHATSDGPRNPEATELPPLPMPPLPPLNFNR